MSWLISQALMNSLSLPEQVEESLEENSLDGEQCVPLNGNHTQQAYCAPDKMTVFSRLSRYGMTYKPLTESRGEELLTLYLEAFLVRTSQSQEKAQVLMESDQECGEKWRASFVKFDPDTHLWKTHQCSLLGDLEQFLETWPRWGLMRDGECWEQLTLEQTIRGTESGLSAKHSLPTPTCNPHMPNKNANTKGPKNLVEVAQGKWEHLMPLEKFPTPTVFGNYNRKGASKTSGDGLATKVGGKLNPMWVEWLMGFPLGWTDLKPLETDKSHFAPQQLGES